MPGRDDLRRLCQAFAPAPSIRSMPPQWAAALNLSTRTFNRVFRAETGLTFQQWRQRACVLHAIRLLSAGIERHADRRRAGLRHSRGLFGDVRTPHRADTEVISCADDRGPRRCNCVTCLGESSSRQVTPSNAMVRVTPLCRMSIAAFDARLAAGHQPVQVRPADQRAPRSQRDRRDNVGARHDAGVQQDLGVLAEVTRHRGQQVEGAPGPDPVGGHRDWTTRCHQRRDPPRRGRRRASGSP